MRTPRNKSGKIKNIFQTKNKDTKTYRTGIQTK